MRSILFVFQIKKKFKVSEYYGCMEQTVYERPREKLLHRGVKSLSVVELLQLIISSGNKSVSSASIAREIHELIIADRVSYENLISIDGVGVAKACQIVAVYELASRVSTAS